MSYSLQMFGILILATFNVVRIRANCIGSNGGVEYLSNNYGGDLMRYNTELTGDPNSMFSPLSVANMLAQLREGSVGTTRNEFDNTQKNNLFGYFNNDKKLRVDYNNSREVLKEYKLALFIDSSIYLLPKFIGNSSTFYGAEIQSLDFELTPNVTPSVVAKASRVAINTWAQSNSVSMVTATLFTTNQITSSTRMVAVNTLDFQLNLPFVGDSLDKTMQTFRLSNGTDIEIGMQEIYADGYHQNTQTNNGRTPDVFRVDISPTEELYFFVENNGVRGHDMEHDFCKEYTRWMRLANREKIILRIPTFMNEYRMNVGHIHHHRSGIVHAFKPTAQYDGMTNNTMAYYSQAIHQVSLEIGNSNAKPTTQAINPSAANLQTFPTLNIPENCELICTTTVATPAARPNYRKFTVDRPYMFIVRNKATRAVLLYGRVNRP